MNPDDRERILDLLRRDARLTAVQIADRLSLASSEVAEYIQQCEREHLIRGYYALLQDDALGHRQARALIEVQVEPERDIGFDRVARSLSRFSNVTDVILVSGSYDLLLIVVGKDLHEIADFVAGKLSPLGGIRSTRTHFMLKKYKESGISLEAEDGNERLSVSP